MKLFRLFLSGFSRISEMIFSSKRKFSKLNDRRGSEKHPERWRKTGKEESIFKELIIKNNQARTTEQRAASGQVQDLEERAPDHDGRAQRIGYVEEALPRAAAQETSYPVDVRSGGGGVHFFRDFLPVPFANPICERTQRNPI